MMFLKKFLCSLEASFPPSFFSLAKCGDSVSYCTPPENKMHEMLCLEVVLCTWNPFWVTEAIFFVS